MIVRPGGTSYEIKFKVIEDISSSLENKYLKAIQLLTAIKRPISTDLNTTPKNAPMQATKSNLSVFQIRYAASKSIRPITAVMMIDARMEFGVYLKSGVISSKVKNTTVDITTLEIGVWQPAM